MANTVVEIIKVTDLPAALQSTELIADLVAGANAKAARVAPCLVNTAEQPWPEQKAEAKLILLGAIKRWADAGSGAFQQQTAGPFSAVVDTRQRTGYNLWPSEIKDLQEICKKADDENKAFGVDTVPGGGSHSVFCSIHFGGSNTCSCGANIAGTPIYEPDDDLGDIA